MIFWGLAAQTKFVNLSKKVACGWDRLVTFLTMWLMAFLFSGMVTSSGLWYA